AGEAASGDRPQRAGEAEDPGARAAAFAQAQKLRRSGVPIGMAARRLIAAIDQGTTSSRCILFDENAGIVAAAQKEHRQIFPRPGWVEHDPLEIWENVRDCVHMALARAGVSRHALAAIGITNQRETCVV